ncbi:MAG: hypothetical protein KAT77_06550 [Nanoarchaeota archaeon]|nr:hypothetical protein [Nanoarchaeota archaeon]
MKIIIDRNGNVGFDEWFDEEDVDKLVNALKSKGFEVNGVERSEDEFKAIPALFKKKRYDKIPLSANNIFLILSNADKHNDDILEILGIERESGFVITTLLRKLQGEYVKWEKIDHKEKWKNDEERMKAFARYFESQCKMTDKKIENLIEKMEKEGCRQLLDDKFPECGTEFNKECLKCQFGQKYLKNDADIIRFNQVLHDVWDEE